ncbi:MAG: virulence protein SciE type [Candidatus Rokuibacteriota bacterium]|nr:MAG: virulence protein SciE type [Candidatus Rokubacteria bacterium]
MLAEQSLREGRVEQALTELQDQVRKAPDNAEYRVFLFQLLCVLGDWDRARAQLKVLGELSVGSLPLVHVYGAAITCELLRREVFAGARTPLVLGEPLPWVALLFQALSVAAQGRAAEATALRSEALEKANAVPGTIDGQAFEWIADGDSRLGPVCEAIVDGRYYWVPFERLRSVTLEAPADLRDVLWMPAKLGLANGGEATALIPARYPGSEADGDGLIRLSRKTEWDEVAPDTFHGRGQRMFATAEGEHALLSVRRIELGGAEA